MAGRTRYSAAALALGVVLTGSALAAAPAPPPTIDVRPDTHGASGVVRASIDIGMPPARVWAVLVDCPGAPRLMVNLRSCRILDRDPAGRWDVREDVTSASLLPAVRAVLRSEYDYPHSVRFHRVDGDFKVLEGQWLLTPLDGGTRTRVTYESRMSAPFAAPGFLMRVMLRKDLSLSLIHLRQVSEGPVITTRRAVATAP